MLKKSIHKKNNVFLKFSLTDVTFFSRIEKRVRLTINTEPENADIKIIGMKRAYKKGMKLNVGQYTIRITSPTYNPREIVVQLEEEHSTFNIQLTSSIEQISCREDQQGFPLEFINKYYLKKLNNCTYQLLAGKTTNTPFKLLVTKNSHQSKHLMKARLEIKQYGPSGNVASLLIAEIKPRAAKIIAGSSGINDVPESIRPESGLDLINRQTRLTILDATFSY